MMRPILVVLGFVATLLMSTNTEAQTTDQDSDGVRYNYNRVDNGFLRLDMRSGEVSMCSPAAGHWSCDPVPDDRRALGNDIERLQRENAALKKALLDNGLPLPNGINTDISGSSDRGNKTESGNKTDSGIKIDSGNKTDSGDKIDTGKIDNSKIDNGTIDHSKTGDRADKLLKDGAVAFQVIVVKLWRELVVMIMDLENRLMKKT
jgi:hypothetical protein